MSGNRLAICRAAPPPDIMGSRAYQWDNATCRRKVPSRRGALALCWLGLLLQTPQAAASAVEVARLGSDGGVRWTLSNANGTIAGVKANVPGRLRFARPIDRFSQLQGFLGVLTATLAPPGHTVM